MPQWIRIQGKNAEGWLGIEKKKNEWVYSISGEEVSIDFCKLPSTSDGSCVYLKGKKGKWFADSCGEVRSFICEFKGISMLITFVLTKPSVSYEIVDDLN